MATKANSITIFLVYIPDQASDLLHFLTSGWKHCRISWGGSISLQCPVGGRGGKFRPASPQLVFIITVDRGGGGRCAEPGKSRAQSGILFMHIVEYHSRTIWSFIHATCGKWLNFIWQLFEISGIEIEQATHQKRKC